MTDWNKEAEQIGSSNFWKPETGQYKVKFLNDGQPTTFEDKRSGRITEQVDFAVEVEGREKMWTVTKARTVNSLYGQIVLLGRHHGAVSEKEFTLFVKFDKPNNKREYTIQEALPLIETWNTRQGQGNEGKEEPQGSPETPLDKLFKGAK